MKNYKRLLLNGLKAALKATRHDAQNKFWLKNRAPYTKAHNLEREIEDIIERLEEIPEETVNAYFITRRKK